MENLSIPLWAEDDRPREKMTLKGRNALSNAELIAILIGSGTRKKTAVELAQEILNSYGNNLRELSKATLGDLLKFEGIGAAKATSIVAAMELARRRDKEPPEAKIKVTSSKQAYEYFKPFLSDLYHEEFYALFLNNNNIVLRSDLLSTGGMTSTLVDSRLLFHKAIENRACSIILAHNHPSGVLKPSEADEKLTERLVGASKMLGIPILDHIIVTDNGYYSFADEGKM